VRALRPPGCAAAVAAAKPGMTRTSAPSRAKSRHAAVSGRLCQRSRNQCHNSRVIGLVEGEAAGARNMYRLRADGALAVRAYIEGVWGEAAARFRLATANTPRPRTQR